MGGWAAGCANLSATPGPIRATTAGRAASAAVVPATEAEARSAARLVSAGRAPAAVVPARPTPERLIVYGRSVQGRPLIAYRLGHGPVARALVGGMHGGYEWNTTALLSGTLDFFAATPGQIPAELTLYVIPVANPDGAAAGMDRKGGRLNANGVDLNRNWDYHWQMTATHGVWPVFAGTHPFSEPETAALRDFILERDIDVVVLYHSAAAEVYSGAGEERSQTVALARRLAEATGYRYAPEGVPSQITTGNAIDWLTSRGITAAEVELRTHHSTDWERNLRGILAVLTWRLPNTMAE